MDTPTIEDAKVLQKALGLTDRHLVWIGSEGWVIAHTDDERESGEDLEECWLHRAMEAYEEQPPVKVGYYVVWHLFTPLERLLDSDA